VRVVITAHDPPARRRRRAAALDTAALPPTWPPPATFDATFHVTAPPSLPAREAVTAAAPARAAGAAVIVHGSHALARVERTADGVTAWGLGTWVRLRLPTRRTRCSSASASIATAWSTPRSCRSPLPARRPAAAEPASSTTCRLPLDPARPRRPPPASSPRPVIHRRRAGAAQLPLDADVEAVRTTDESVTSRR
jgi:hypothetical protein